MFVFFFIVLAPGLDVTSQSTEYITKYSIYFYMNINTNDKSSLKAAGDYTISRKYM